jgi:AhpD family alkylhydroperoxidase
MQRVNYAQQSPELLKRFVAFNNAFKESTIEQSLRDLVTLRASQLNGWGFCVGMHVKEAKITASASAASCRKKK